MTERKGTTARGNSGNAESGTQANASLAPIVQLHSRMFRDALKFNAEILDFARRRLDEDIKAAEKLTKCQTVPDAMSVMNDFCQCAAQQYSEEISNLAQLGRKITTEAVHEIQAAPEAKESEQPTQ